MLVLLVQVQSESVLPFFTSTESKEFKSNIGSHNRTKHCARRQLEAGLFAPAAKPPGDPRECLQGEELLIISSLVY